MVRVLMSGQCKPSCVANQVLHLKPRHDGPCTATKQPPTPTHNACVTMDALPHPRETTHIGASHCCGTNTKGRHFCDDDRSTR